MSVTLKNIQDAAKLIQGEVVATPTVHSAGLSDLTGADVFCKLETLQRTGSFKDRGAFVKMSHLTKEERKNGVIAMSAGNHAQAVAYHAQRLGLPATIVMPEGTPFTKITKTQSFGARVELHGTNINTAEPHAKKLQKEEGLTFVHPYNDELIIAGQGTIGLELANEVEGLDVVIVPIGGGGVISGVATAVKNLSPQTQVIGVEAAHYPSMYQKINGLPANTGGETIAEGIAVKTPGEINVGIIKELVDDIVLVDEPTLERSVQIMLEVGRVLAEGAGAAPLAAVLADPERFAGLKVALVVCGSNIDPRILSSLLMRGLSQNGRLVHLRVEIKDGPGVLSQVAQQIGATGANIIDVQHQRMFHDLSVKQAKLDFMLETRDSGHIQEITTRLEAAGFQSTLLPMTAGG